VILLVRTHGNDAGDLESCQCGCAVGGREFTGKLIVPKFSKFESNSRTSAPLSSTSRISIDITSLLSDLIVEFQRVVVAARVELPSYFTFPRQRGVSLALRWTPYCPISHSCVTFSS
jgi:hypothetical protein